MGELASSDFFDWAASFLSLFFLHSCVRAECRRVGRRISLGCGGALSWRVQLSASQLTPRSRTPQVRGSYIKYKFLKEAHPERASAGAG